MVLKHINVLVELKLQRLNSPAIARVVLKHINVLVELKLDTPPRCLKTKMSIKAYQCSCRTETLSNLRDAKSLNVLKHINVLVELKP